MAALACLLVAFLWCTTVGLACTSVLGDKRDTLRNLLIAPATGIAVLVLPAYWLSRAGLTASAFAIPLATLELAIAVFILSRFRVRVKRFDVALFSALSILGAATLAWPLVSLGYNWIAFAQPDIGSYGLAAARYLHSSFSQLPAAPDILFNRDLTAQYWFFDNAARERTGPQFLLVILAVWTHQLPIRVVVVLSLCAYLATINATAGLLAFRDQSRVGPAFAGSAMALSSLGAFGTYLGLLGQTCGMPLLVALVRVIADLRDFAPADYLALRKSAILAGILSAALGLVYPELSSLFIASAIIYVLVLLFRRRVTPRAVLAYLGTMAATAIASLNIALPDILYVLTSRSGILAKPQHLFEQYLVPSGLADLWGFMPLYLPPADPWLSVAIAAGGMLAILTLLGSAYYAWKGSIAACACVVFAGFSVYLYMHSLDFPLFKIAMYIQPFLLSGLCVSAFGLSGHRTRLQRQLLSFKALALGAVFLVGILTQQTYVKISVDKPGSEPLSFSSIPNGSTEHFLDQAQQAAGGSRKNSHIVLDSTDITVQSYVSSFTRGLFLDFPGTTYMEEIGYEISPPILEAAARHSPWIAEFERTSQRLHPKATFSFHTASLPQTTEFSLDRTLDASGGSPETATYWLTSPRLSVLNRFNTAWNAPDISASSYAQMHNRLVLVDHRYADVLPWERRLVALTPSANDYFYNGGPKVQGFGRYELFEVLHPSRKMRIVFSLTESDADDAETNGGDRRIPPIQAIGDTRIPLRAVGWGSARLISAEIAPQWIGGHAFVALDMGRAPKMRRYPKTGLMRLYGLSVPLDNTLLVGRARDISAISSDRYLATNFPSRLNDVPEALRSNTTFYSGIYEDGYVDRKAWVTLDSPKSNEVLLASGFIDQDVRKKTTIGLLVDGKPLVRQAEGSGPFVMIVPFRSLASIHRVDVIADSSNRRPAPDSREVSFRLTRIGFYASNELAHSLDIVDLSGPVSLGAGWYDFEAYNGEHFRWVNNDAEIHLSAASTPLGLEIAAEPGPGLGGKPFRLSLVSGSSQIASTIVAGGQPVEFRIPPHAGDESFTLHVSGGGQRVPTDPRILNFRVLSISLQRLADIPLPNGVALDEGWYPLEHYAGETFRWARDGAIIAFQNPMPAPKLLIEPGPSIGTEAMRLEVIEGPRISQSFTIAGRSWITIDASRGGKLTFRVLNGGKPVATDPRTLDFRIFRIADKAYTGKTAK